MDFTFTNQLHYLIHFVDGEYVAHCLDMDLVGTGKNKSDAIEELNTAVRAVVFLALKTENAANQLFWKKAPKRYYSMFEKAKAQSGTETRTLKVDAKLSPVLVNQCHLMYCMAVAA